MRSNQSKSLKGQILDVIEQSQNRAFLEYRTMINKNSNAEPPADSGYFSSHSRSGSSQGSGGNRLSSDLIVGSSILPAAEPDGTLASKNISSQFIAMDFDANLETTAPAQQGFGNMSSSEVCAPIQGTSWNGSSSLEAEYIEDPLLFSDLPWWPHSEMDLDTFNWDSLIEGNTSTN